MKTDIAELGILNGFVFMSLTKVMCWLRINVKTSVLAVLGVISLLSMTPAYAGVSYLKSIGGVGNDSAGSVLDRNGNRYFLGALDNPLDVDPGPGVFTISGSVFEQNKKFISKIDSSGNFLWAKKIVGPYSAAMNVNSLGHIFITGIFFGTVDFDPGSNVENLTSVGQSDIYILELDSAGNFVRVLRVGSTGSEEVNDIFIDANDAIYMTGFFSGTIDLDPGMGVANLMLTSQSHSVFVMKLDVAGNYVWAKELAQNGGDAKGYRVVVDDSGNIYTSGFFSQTADFDPGPAVATLVQGDDQGSANAFISKLDPDGNFLWARAWVSDAVADSWAYAYAGPIVLSGSGDVYVEGSFSGQVDLDPGVGQAVAVSAGGTDTFVVKLDAAGNYQWGKSIGGTGWDSGGIALDNSDSPYVYGSFTGSVDFDPGAGVKVRTSAGGNDAYILKLDSNGNYLRVTTWGGAGDDGVGSVSFDAARNIFSTGVYSGVVDFDPDKFIGKYLSALGGQDIYIAKFDVDSDNDGYADIVDAFPNDNALSGDRDSDGIDNIVDVDNDNDGMSDDYEIQNGLHPSNNADANFDTDGDSLTNLQEFLLGTFANNPDSDGDTVSDGTDVFPLDPNESLDFDNDQVGDNADSDDDNDGVADAIDNCPRVVNASQLDIDGDGYGNACDALPMNPTESKDSDGDGVGDNRDNCTLAVNLDQKNIDGDSYGDACDNNSDNDGTSDSGDNCPRVDNNQQDSDNNGIGDACEITKYGFYRDLMGSAVAMMDMDKDGYSDVIVSAPGAMVSFNGKVLNNVGIVQVISGATGLIDKTYFGEGVNSHFGVAVVGVPDRTGDGMPDLLIGEPFSDVATTVSGKSVVIKRAGRVSLYSGANGAFVKVVASGSAPGALFGASLALGSVNSDGVADMVVGSPMANVSVSANGKFATLKNAGKISVFNGVNNKELYTRGGSQPGEHFGASVAVDAKHQILVGSPERDVNVTVGSKVTKLVDAGGAQIFDGASNATPAVSTLYGIRKGDRLGAAVSSFRSDINNDGADDWAVGIPGVPDYVITSCHGYDEDYYCNEALRGDVGAVLVLSGNQAQQVKFYRGYTNSVGKGSKFGSAIAADGDIGRDHVNDLIVGAPKLTVPYQVTYEMKNSGVVTGFSGKRVGSGLSSGYQ